MGPSQVSSRMPGSQGESALKLFTAPLFVPLSCLSFLLFRPELKNTGGALYIRAAMQFIRLPLKTDPKASLRSSIELTKVIGQIPGMVRFGPV